MENTRLLNSDKSSIGEDDFDSHHMKENIEPIKTRNPTIIGGEDQPKLPPLDKVRRNINRAEDDKVAPIQSYFLSFWSDRANRDESKRNSMPKNVMVHSGRLIQKIQCQLRYVTKTPPKIGPIIPPAPIMLP